MSVLLSDVRYVIHYSLPKSLTNYYQESGRAGRDGDKSECILYFAYKDKSTLASMITKGNDSGDVSYSKRRDSIKSGMDNLFKCVRYCLNEVDCRRTLLLEYFGESFPSANCGKTCDNCRRTGRVESVDFTVEAQRIIKCTEEYLNLGGNIGAPTLNSIGRVYMNAKGKGMEKFDKIVTRCLDSRRLTRDLCERLLQQMTIEGYLIEESKVLNIYLYLNILLIIHAFTQPNASGFSADYANLGPRAHELTCGRAIVCLNVRHSSTTLPNESFEDIENSPIEDEAFNKKKDTKRKKAPVTDIVDTISGDDENNMSINSTDEPGAYAAKRIKSTHTVSGNSSLLYKPQYDRKNANDASGNYIPDNSYLETPIGYFNETDDHLGRNTSDYNQNNSNHIKSRPDKKVSSHKRNQTYVISDSDDDTFEEMLAKETRKPVEITTEINKTKKRAITSNQNEIRAVQTEPTTEASPPVQTKFTMTRQQKIEFQAWLFEYRKRWPVYWNYMDNAVVKSIINEVPMTKDDLSRIPKFGQSKTLRVGDHILATIWAFLNQKHLLEHFPEEQRRKPSIPECPTWMDPASAEADEIRNKKSSEEKEERFRAASVLNNDGSKIAASNDADVLKWHQAGVGSSNRSGPVPVLNASPFFATSAPSPAKNIYSPTDHAANRYTPLKHLAQNRVRAEEGGAGFSPGGFQSHSLGALQQSQKNLFGSSNPPSGQNGHRPAPPSSQAYASNGASTADVLSPEWISNRPGAGGKASVGKSGALPPADTVYGKTNDPNGTSDNKRIFSMEY